MCMQLHSEVWHYCEGLMLGFDLNKSTVQEFGLWLTCLESTLLPEMCIYIVLRTIVYLATTGGGSIAQ